MNDDGSPLRKRAALYFQLCRVGPRTSFEMMVASNPGMADLIRNCSPSERGLPTSLLEACRATRRDAEIRCAGLVEYASGERDTREIPIPWYGDEYLDLADHAFESMKFQFIHRTAGDFLTDTAEGQEILDASPVSYDNARLRVVEARLVAARLFRWPPVCYGNNTIPLPKNTFDDHLGSILSLQEPRDGKAHDVRADCTRLLLFLSSSFSAVTYSQVGLKSLSPTRITKKNSQYDTLGSEPSIYTRSSGNTNSS